MALFQKKSFADEFGEEDDASLYFEFHYFNRIESEEEIPRVSGSTMFLEPPTVFILYYVVVLYRVQYCQQYLH